MAEPRFIWNRRGDLLCGRVKVGSVRHQQPFPDWDVAGPWFGEVGQGYPAPFEDWFDTEEGARRETEAAARRLMFEEDGHG